MIIHEVVQYADVDINIMNLHGIIVSSTDRNRINTVHTGSFEVLKSEKPLIINKSTQYYFPGSKSGINSPIMHLGKIRGVVVVSGLPEEVKQVSGLIRASVEIVLQQIYIQRQAQFAEREWNNWVQKLLHSNTFNENKLKDEAEYLFKIRFEEMWRVIVIEGERIHQFLESMRQEVEEQKIPANLTLSLQDEEVIVLVPANFKRISSVIKNIQTQLPTSFKAGVGGSCFGMKGIRTSYFQAKQAKSFMKDDALISFSDQWKVSRLITLIPKEEYNQVCGQYEQALFSLREELLRTVKIYFEHDFSIKQTALSLHIHRNTLIYRLYQIKEKVKLDPRSFHDAILLK